MEICIQSRILYREEFWELVPIESKAIFIPLPIPIHIDRYRAWHYICTENNSVYMYTSELNYSIYYILGSSMMVFYDDHFGQGYSAKLIFRHLRFSKLVGWQSVLLQTQ